MKRRDFFKNMTGLVVVPSILSSLSVKAVNPLAVMTAIANADNTDRVLVLVQLRGGNDGLNTVIPLDKYAAYAAARSNIAIKQTDVLPLSAVTNVGLHPSMTGIQQKFTDGKIKIIQSVGYPSPNFSHFRATDIWLSASNSTELLYTGWVGRYLDSQFLNYPTGYPNAKMPDPLAIEVGSILSLGFQGQSMNMSISVSNPTDFYKLISGVQDEVPNTPAGKELAYIRTTALQTNQYATTITQAANNVSAQSGSYPTAGKNVLADQLKIVARLIAGGLKTKVYVVNMSGFDTHNAQVDETNTSIGTHATLLSKVSEAISAFMDDLKFLNIEQRVVGMTFSEFGRRIMSNKSFGTDHGAAAPMFIFGAKVISGVLGTTPAIPTNVTVNDNIPMQYDFRSVYASLLQQWFGLDTAALDAVMLRSFQQLPLINNDGTDIKTTPLDAGKSLVSCYPNPFSDQTTVRFETAGGHTLVEVFDVKGRKITTLTDREYSAGIYSLIFEAAAYPSGIYYARLQNQLLQQTAAMVKK